MEIEFDSILEKWKHKNFWKDFSYEGLNQKGCLIWIGYISETRNNSNQDLEPCRSKELELSLVLGPHFETSILIKEDPTSYKEAIDSMDSELWKEAIDSELESNIPNEPWNLVELLKVLKP